MPLLERADSLLVVVDAQPGFYRPAAPDDAPALDLALARAAWLTGVAAALDVPIVVTEEAPERNGATDPRIVERLPSGTPVLAKAVFGLADDPPVMAAVVATDRGTAVLVGTETDVCVTHSAVGLADRGFRVVVVPDATHSPGAMQAFGLARLAAAGIELVHAKGIYDDWIRTVEAALAFERTHPDLASPPGFAI